MKKLVIVAAASILLSGCWEKYSPGKHFNVQGEGGGKPKTENTTPAPVPEPATMLLLGVGLIGLGIAARRVK